MVNRVLIVDDDVNITALLQVFLESEGFLTAIAPDGETALRKFEEESPDIILLDLLLPGINGIDVCKAIRSQSKVPIIIITCLSESETELQCMDIGADDYFRKPLDLDRLVSHIKAVLRRTASQLNKKITAGNIEINCDARRVTVDGKEIILTRKEFDVFNKLALNKGKVVTYREMLIEIWGEECTGAFGYVQDCVRSLRHKIEPDPSIPRYIINVAGVGYRFDA